MAAMSGPHTFIGGYEIDPSQPAICQICEKRRDDPVHSIVVHSAMDGLDKFMKKRPLLLEIENFLEERANEGSIAGEAYSLLTQLRETFTRPRIEAPQARVEATAPPAGELAAPLREPEPFSARLQQRVIGLVEAVQQARAECGGALSLDWHAKADRALDFLVEGHDRASLSPSHNVAGGAVTASHGPLNTDANRRADSTEGNHG